jgi:glycosyltransferase involved in cell wall biosynthesis
MIGPNGKPSICIDAYNMALPEGSGIATYGRNLLTNLRELGHETSVLYGPNAARTDSPVLNEVALIDVQPPPKGKVPAVRRALHRLSGRLRPSRAFPVPPTGEVVWPSTGATRPDTDMFWASQRLYHDALIRFRGSRTVTDVAFAPGAPGPDICHWTTLLPVRARDARNLYTIHDLIPLRLPHTTLDDKGVFLNLCRAVARHADRIAVVSEATRQDVIRILGVSEERVVTTYQSVSIPARVTDRAETDAARDIEGIFGLEWKSYYLYFGAIEPKKNVRRIIEGYLASRVRGPLVIVGGRAWLADKEAALLKGAVQRAEGGPHQIVHLQYLPYDMLMTLARGARATIFPSLYEGFGLPVLESMLLGTAVLTSTAGSLPEVSGDAAHLVDPYDLNAISEGLRTLDADQGYREELQRKGPAQAAKFSPERYRERLGELYALS